MEQILVDQASSLLRSIGAKPPFQTQRLGGGRNSKVFRVLCREAIQLVVKFYFHHENDHRDRMGNEFRAYQFLRRNGITCVPRPIAFDQANQVALFEYIEGDQIKPEMVDQSLVEKAVDFLSLLKDLAREGAGSELSSASEACFSIASILSTIDQRLKALAVAAESSPTLQQFLGEVLLPFKLRIEGWCCDRCARLGWNMNQELDSDLRSLSPSDFGFHNALLRPTGGIAFVDFEYFGWDDPAKTTVDFLLHPAMNLLLPHKICFVSGMISCFSNDPRLKERVRLVYPLFGLKWCCIFLNEFVTHHQARRDFANSDNRPREETHSQQLRKAKNLVRQLDDDCQQFPYLP